MHVDGEENWKTDKDYNKRVFNIIKKEKRLLVLSKYPGCGKSYNVNKFIRRKKNHLVVYAFNNQKEEMKAKFPFLNIKTVSKLLSTGIDKRHM